VPLTHRHIFSLNPVRGYFGTTEKIPSEVGYLLGSYRIAIAPEPSSSRLTSFK
jgi:hypothetical protein